MINPDQCQSAWSHLLEYFDSNDREFLKSVKGVSAEEIVRVENACGVTLPSFYRNFLLTMGEDSGSLRPCGSGDDHSIFAQNAESGLEDYSPKDFFMIAVNTDPSAISPPDLFLDLRHTNGCDAPLVESESPVPSQPLSNWSAAESFAERVMKQSFRSFDLKPKRFKATIMVLPSNSFQEGVPAHEAIRLAELEAPRRFPVIKRLLEGNHFKPALPVTDALACYKRNDLAIQAFVHGPCVHLALGGNEEGPLEQIAARIVKDIPDAKRGKSR